jgi:hypothetical protein
MGIPIPNPVYLQALDGSVWAPAVTNGGIADTVEMSLPPGMSAVPWYELTDAITGTTWRLVVQPCPSQPAGQQGELHVDPTALNPSAPVQLLVSAPNGIVYFLQIANGILQSGLATPANASCNTAISVLAQNVQDRLEEPRGPGIFWSQQFEILTALVEAENELLLLVGRPTLTVQSPLNLNPNTVWQAMPKGLLAITDIYGPQSLLRKISLFSLDFEQASWGSDWECDSSTNGPVRWAPIGLSNFVVHPAAASPQQVLINAVQYPVGENWPYSGNETVVFEHHWFEALEMYAAVYCRLKESGPDFQNSLAMLAEFYQIAQRMTQIQDRRDPLIFAKSFGVPAGVNAIPKR